MATRRRSTTILAAVLVALAGGAGTGCRKSGESAGASGGAARVQYHCPMHPTYVSDKPGECRICGMRLVPYEASPSPGTRTVLYYRSPMDPGIRSNTPGKDSMGMDFVPVYADEVAAGMTDKMSPGGGHRHGR